MFSNIRLALVAIALGVCVLLSCSEDAVAPSGDGSFSREEDVVWGYCTYIYESESYPLEDALCILRMHPENGVITDGYTDTTGYYALTITGEDPDDYKVTVVPPDPPPIPGYWPTKTCTPFYWDGSGDYGPINFRWDQD